tara:strand:+ start:1056 stop:1478 length:423 start_codon:yes stop_codon:yes gene_type:complete
MEEKRKPGRPMGATGKHTKMNRAEQLQFEKESIKVIMDNHLSWKEYIRWCKEYDISQDRGNFYWNKSWKTIREKYELDRVKQISKHLMKYWRLHDGAITRGDLNTARQTLNDIAKLMGLNEPDKVENNDTISFNFGTDED